MKNLLILGTGTAGTMLANMLRRRLPSRDWAVTTVDRDDGHLYQPGLLFVPFEPAKRHQLTRSRRALLAPEVTFVLGDVDVIEPAAQRVLLTDGRSLDYDYLVIASGTTPRPDQTPGMLGAQWRTSIFDFYTLEGATALARALTDFDHGRLVVHVTDMPIKCPVAPLEFAFLADDWLRNNGRRDRVDLTYVTPLPGAFTKPVASEHLHHMLTDRAITTEPDFLVESIDPQAKTLVSFDQRVIPFDLLVTVPLNMGADFVARSGLGDELNHVRVDPHTFASKVAPNIFAVGDAADLPTSKAGSVAHFAAHTFVDNFMSLIEGEPLSASFDGHANCFIESGNHNALLIDFNYDTEPLPGSYPIPLLGPFQLLKETRTNHLGKLAFRWLYWNVLLPGRPLPLPTSMSMAGKTPVPQ
ncbi:MAG TPA: FAD/NAD(P)-binding oxidoreductase [Pedococcus sp.]|nr:FAD/NAD(P)-binding oxidoreductase [Pedococcus sp.]